MLTFGDGVASKIHVNAGVQSGHQQTALPSATG